MILTEEIFNKGKSIRGGWSNKQLALLDVFPPFIKGWKNTIIGKDFPIDVLAEYVDLKDDHLSDKVIRNKTLRKIGGNALVFEPCVANIPWKDQYLHPNWQKMRVFVFKRDNFRCVNCKNPDLTLVNMFGRFRIGIL